MRKTKLRSGKCRVLLTAVASLAVLAASPREPEVINLPMRAAEPVFRISLEGPLERSGWHSLSWSGAFLEAEYLKNGRETEIVVWDVSKGEIVARYSAPPVFSGQFLRREPSLAVALADRIELYEIGSWDRPIETVPNEQSPQGLRWGSIEISPDDTVTRVFVNDASNSESWLHLQLVDLKRKTAEPDFVLTGYRKWKTALGPGGRLMALPGADLTTIEIWDAGIPILLQRMKPEPIPRWAPIVEDLAMSPDGERLASMHLDATARIFDVASGQETKRLEFEFLAIRRRLDFSPDGRMLAILAIGPCDLLYCKPPESKGPVIQHLSLWDVGTGRFLVRQPGMFNAQNTGVEFSGDGEWLAVREAFPSEQGFQWHFSIYGVRDLLDGASRKP